MVVHRCKPKRTGEAKVTSDRLKEILERKAEERRVANNLQRRVEDEKQGAATERSVDRMLFQKRYDRATENVEKALEKHRGITEDGLARGFLERDEFERIVETSPDADHRVRPGEKLATGQTKGMEDKGRKGRMEKMSEAVMWAAFAYGAEHPPKDKWPAPPGGINDRPAERLVTRDLSLTDQAKERTEKDRNKGRGGPSL